MSNLYLTKLARSMLDNSLLKHAWMQQPQRLGKGLSGRCPLGEMGGLEMADMGRLSLGAPTGANGHCTSACCTARSTSAFSSTCDAS
jgi:hypothetical protein